MLNSQDSPHFQGASPRHARKNSGPMGQFTEGNFYKQVVSFQSNRGQLYNDTSILKNSINQVQRRCDRQAFMKAKMDIAMSQHQASKQLTTQQSVDSKAASPNVTATQGFTFGQPR